MSVAQHTLALKSDGSIWTWGLGSSSQLGDSFSVARSSPISVIGTQNFYLVYPSPTNSFAIQTDGSVWAWGLGSSGQLGNNTGTQSTIPTKVSLFGIFRALSAGLSIAASLKTSDGSAWTWGVGTNGVLGDNTTTTRSSPVSVVGNHSFDRISCGQQMMGALKSDGTAWMWGTGTTGQLGDDSITNKSSPVSVVGAHSFLDIVLGSNHITAIKNDGTVWSWGAGAAGKLGQGTSVANRSSPVSLIGAHSFDQITSGGSYSMAMKANDGSCWAWGLNTFGQLGDGTVIDRSSPVSVIGSHSFDRILGSLGNSYGLKADGSVWAWGDRTSGAIGDNIADFTVSPVQVIGNHNFWNISSQSNHTMALKLADGSCWTWGLGTTGQLGEGTVAVNRSSPVSVVGAHSFDEVTCGGSHSVAVKSNNGTVWCWGLNGSGQLGDNSITNRSSPVSVVGAHSFAEISGGSRHTMAIKSNNGTCWGWGDGASGQIGDGTVNPRSSPVSVVGAHSFTEISAGNFHTLALKANDGSAWSWGSANAGQVGDNTATSRSSPVSVVGAHSFDKIYAGNSVSFGIKANDGSLWAWGSGAQALLAQNTTLVNRSSPVSVVGSHSFTKVVSNGSHAIALKANDGSVWAWGINTNGQLGDGSISTRSSPVSVIGGHSFTDIAVSSTHSMGMKANGEVWSWGYRVSGQLGDNYAEIASSPVQVVGGHTFVNIGPENIHGVNKDYTKQNLLEVTLPSGTKELLQPFDDQDYVDVSTDDNIYVGVDGRPGSKYLNFLFQQRKPGNSTFNVTWRGKSRIACSSFSVRLQVYNVNSGLWETLATNSSTAADTEFALTGSVLSSASNYYDAFSRVTFRIYQQQESLSSSSSSSSCRSSSSSSCSSSCSSSSSSNNPCWIASVIFGGWYAPETIDTRYYFKFLAPKFLSKIYLKHGQRLAKYIENKPLLKITLRPLFELFAFLGHKNRISKKKF